MDKERYWKVVRKYRGMFIKLIVIRLYIFIEQKLFIILFSGLYFEHAHWNMPKVQKQGKAGNP